MKKILLPSGTFVLRPLDSADLVYFLKLGSQTCGSLHQADNQDDDDLSERFRAFAKDYAFRTESDIWVIRNDLEVYAGHIWLTNTTNRFNGIKELWIWDITVAAEFRKQGLGRKLLEHAKARAQELGCAQLWLMVAEDNKIARRLYASFGMADRARMMMLDLKEA